MIEVDDGAESAGLSGADEAELLAGLPPERALAVRELLRERSRLNERYRRVLETTRDAIVITDVQRTIVFANPAAHELFGYPGKQLLDMRVADTLPPDAHESVAAFESAAFAGVPQRYETLITRADGEQRTVSVSTAPLREGDQITGVVASLRDVTDERLMAEQLLQREKLAAVGQLVSGVAHELNNPLAGIMAFAQLLEIAPGIPDEQRDAVQTIFREARRAAKIVSNLLLFARERAPERTSTDLNTVLRDTLELRRYVLYTQQVEVVLDLDEALPTVRADPFQLQQVLLNLLTNAEHALKSAAGPKRITLQTRRVGGRIIARVSDTGHGIPAEQIDRIFNPFFTTKDVGEGTGLGLSISDGIIRQHGGEITVHSVVGRGTTFTIRLPIVPPAELPVSEPAAPVAPSTPRTFLIVDDEPSIRNALVRFLQKQGHVVDSAATGGDALAQLRAKRYDGILLDLRMPDMPGEDVYATLRERDPEHARRVVFATGDVESDSARALLRATRRPYVSKPFVLSAVGDLLCGVAE
jgi:two-component system NtrC family sensor kinase